MNLVYIKVFQYWCDYWGGNPSLSLFFHLFKVQHSSANHAQGHDLIILAHVTNYFEAYFDGMKHFENEFSLVTPINEGAHAQVCAIRIRTENRCTNLFPKFLNQGHFLMENGSYIYKESGMSQKEIYLKKRLITFFKELGYIGGVIPLDEASEKRLKWFIETCLLIDANTKEKRTIIFGELLVPLSLIISYFYLKFLIFWQFSYTNSIKCEKAIHKMNRGI